MAGQTAEIAGRNVSSPPSGRRSGVREALTSHPAAAVARAAAARQSHRHEGRRSVPVDLAAQHREIADEVDAVSSVRLHRSSAPAVATFERLR
jgi:hypothetical protein